MSEAYAIAAVARRTGLYIDTIRAWERRYRLIEPKREPSGARAYSDADVRRLELARDVTRLGHPIRHVAALSNRELQRLLREHVAKPSERALDDAAPAVVGDVLTAIKRYDFQSMQRSLTATALMLPREDFALRVVAPLLRRVGDDWVAGKLEIAQEHAISQLVRNLSGSLALQSVGGEASTRSIVFATPPGESHEFGVTLAALIASGFGFSTALLLPSVPPKELARSARRLGAQIVCIGSMASPDDADTSTFLLALNRAVDARTEVWLGGPHAEELATNAGSRRMAVVPTLESFAERVRAAVGIARP